MFDFDLSEELGLLVQTTRAFGAGQLQAGLRQAELARGVAAQAQEAYARIGLAGLELPAQLGGAALGPLARALVNEELGAADPGAALALDRLGPALYPLLELGGERALSELALPLLQRPGARALLVAPGDAALEPDGGGLSGSIPWLPAQQVELLVVLRDDGALVLREGLAAEPLPGAGLRAAGACALSLRQAPVAARFDGAPGARRALARARVYVGALLVGVLRQAADYSRRYALERVAFGKPIAHHQALAFMIADMHAAVEGARLLLHDAALRAEQGQPCAAEAAGAFVEAVEASRFVGPAAVQILGGHGFMQDHPVEKYMREARALGLLLGGVDAAREQAGAGVCEGEIPLELCALAASEQA